MSAPSATSPGPPPATPPGTPLGAARSDLDTVEAVVRRAGTSFWRGMKMLPPDRRAAMYAIYAFCREVDDIADEGGTPEEKHKSLMGWWDAVEGLYEGRAETPIARVLLLSIQRFALRQEDFIAVIAGMGMDAEADIVAPDLATLDLYCDRAAAAVGRLSVRVFGDASANAVRVAFHLGRALQLTNILRDIREDAERGRLYLPAEYLAEAGVPPDPAGALASPVLPKVCQRLALDARGHFWEARAAMDMCDPTAMKPARLMGATYAAILGELERSGWRDPSRRVSLPVWRKLWLLARYGL